ncbi:MAG: tyrosine-type recombinase/integrase [Candidatus Marinimicrobia bacterium]|nr:tyrosine-type recombinase/integrase [Candidatus Neomarinimicrobiota bacterium]
MYVFYFNGSFDYNSNSLGLALRKRGLSATKIRHTFATTLVRNGMSIYMVAKLLGHKSVKTTEVYYAHLVPEEIKNHTKWLKYQ